MPCSSSAAILEPAICRPPLQCQPFSRRRLGPRRPSQRDGFSAELSWRSSPTGENQDDRPRFAARSGSTSAARTPTGGNPTRGYETATERRSNPQLDPLKHGTSGWIIRAGGTLSGPIPFALRGQPFRRGKTIASPVSLGRVLCDCWIVDYTCCVDSCGARVGTRLETSTARKSRQSTADRCYSPSPRSCAKEVGGMK
jgi:hypothetical protein